MAIPTLTEEQVRTWTPQQKDRWWLENVFRGDMAQLTVRSAITGFVLGGLLSATNLYIGAKTGWTLGVGLTSVILAFAMFKVLSRAGARDMTILENNAMQSIATSAGYMTGPLISGMAAYMMVTDRLLPWWQMLLFNVVLSVLGVLVAFPMKRRFINNEQAPFPEGQACGVVLDTLYNSDAHVGLFKAKALAVAAVLAGFLKFISGEHYQLLLQCRLLGRDKAVMMAEHLDAWYYALAEKGRVWMPSLFGVDPRKLALSPTLDLAMFGAGGLMHIRYAANMMVGMMVAWMVAAPVALNHGWVLKKGVAVAAAGAANQRNDVLVGWVLWPGVAMLVCASLTGFFAKPDIIVNAFKGLFRRGATPVEDPVRHIELPLWVSLAGVPLVGAVGVWMAHSWFGVRWELGALAIPLIVVLTLIAVTATAATSITPTGSLSKITQLTFGLLNPRHPGTNLMTATMTTEVASNAANLLMDIKPGYMLGAKPRQQAIGHCIGIVAGAIASTPLFFVMFLAGHPGNPFTGERAEQLGKTVQERLTEGDKFSGALQWKGISDFIAGLTSSSGLSSIMHPSALTALIIGAVVGVIAEVVRVLTKNKSPFSPVAFAIGVVIPEDSTLWMFLGSAFFWLTGRMYKHRSESYGNTLWVKTHEPICAGLIAGAALVGIGDNIISAFLL
ncbi:MAG: OPT/YSL family transporter [Phycisphaerales bacterium]